MKEALSEHIDTKQMSATSHFPILSAQVLVLVLGCRHPPHCPQTPNSSDAHCSPPYSPRG